MRRILGNIIHPSYFHFTHGLKRIYNQTKFRSAEKEELYGVLACHIMWPNLNISGSNYGLYKVNIFRPSDCVDPFESDGQATKSMVFKYHKTFKAKDFIDHIFNVLQNSQQFILMDETFKELMNMYFGRKCVDDDEKDDDDVDMIQDNVNHNESVKCILSEKAVYSEWDCLSQCHRKTKHHKAYNQTEMVYKSHDKIVMFNLYMIRTKSQNKLKNTKLKIAFICDESESNNIGLPLYVWINEQDTLELIIGQYLSRVSKYIMDCYRLRDEKRTSIPKCKWHEYELNNEFNVDQDILLIKMKKLESECLFYTQLSGRIYKEFGLNVSEDVNDPMIEQGRIIGFI